MLAVNATGQSASGARLTVNRHWLLSFFDDSKDVAAHANAIKAVAGEELGFALLLEYFRRKGIVAESGPRSWTTGKAKGPRLDGWVVVTLPSGSDVYYQVEVKTWSQHSLSGRRLPVSAPSVDLSEFKKERWRRYWLENTFKDKELAKVLIPMEPPGPGVVAEPLACLWDAVHHTGGDDSFFTVMLPAGGHFDKVHVFSMSGFLRGLADETLELELPDTRERLNWLSKIFRQ
jgi:hypothetical protein